MSDLRDRVSRRLSRAFADAEALSDDELVDELVGRMERVHHRRASSLLEDMARRLPPRLGAALVPGAQLVRPMGYERHGIELLVSSAAIDLRLEAAAKEPFTIEWLERSVKPGDVLYDIGANVGPYALIAAKLTGSRARIFAFEPAAPSFHDLCRNVILNGCQDAITPLPFALWSETNLLVLEYSSLETGAARHRLHEEGAHGAYGLGTAVFALDELVERLGLPLPNHVKLDVDGPELEVLRGARSTLSGDAVRTLMIELDEAGGATNDEAIESFVGTLGFVDSGRHEREATDAPSYRSFERKAA